MIRAFRRVAAASLITLLPMYGSPADAIMRGQVSRDQNGVRASTVVVEIPEGLCTGTVIGPRLVVTAAHCLARKGRYRLSYVDENFRSVSVPVSRSVRHPGFDPGNGFSPDDIGLIEVARPFPPSLVPASLPGWMGWGSGSGELTIAGYGSTERSGPLSRKLRETTLEAHESTVQGRGFSGLSGTNGGRNSGMCVGDSGGPVYQRSGNGLTIVGILKGGSTDPGKDCTSRPVYVKVRDYTDWIEERARAWGADIGPIRRP